VGARGRAKDRYEDDEKLETPNFPENLTRLSEVQHDSFPIQARQERDFLATVSVSASAATACDSIARPVGRARSNQVRNGKIRVGFDRLPATEAKWLTRALYRDNDRAE